MTPDYSAPAPYYTDGGTVVPTDWAKGPWFGDQQHGACVLGLLVRSMEQVPSYSPMRYTRITADLSRPVPMNPMTLEARALRDGKRVQSVEATVAVAGEVVSRAVGTRIRVEPGLVPEELIPPLDPEDKAPTLPLMETPQGVAGPSFQDCFEVRGLEGPNPSEGEIWYRLKTPLVLGEPVSRTVHLAATADMVMSSASRLGEDWVSINPEVSFQIERELVGDWICIASTPRFGDDGVGVSEAVLFDESGRIGRSAKSVLNFPRPG